MGEVDITVNVCFYALIKFKDFFSLFYLITQEQFSQFSIPIGLAVIYFLYFVNFHEFNINITSNL